MTQRFSAIRKTIPLKKLWVFALSLLPNILSALMEGLSFAFILLAFQTLSPEGSSPTYHLLPILNRLNTADPSQKFVYFIILAILSQILRSTLVYVGQIITLSFSTKIQVEIQKKIYQRILQLSFPFVSRYKIGDLLDYTKIPDHLMGALIDPLNRLTVSALSICVSIGIMLFISIPLTLFAIFVFGILSFSQKRLIHKIADHSKQLSVHTVEFSKYIVQSLNGLRLIHTFARQNQMIQTITHTLKQTSQALKKLNSWSQAIGPINEIMGVGLVGLFLWVGQFLLRNEGPMAIAMLLTFIMISYRLNGRLQIFLSAIGTIAFNWGAIARLEEILDDEGKEFIIDEGSQEIEFRHQITFSHVSLRYPDSGTPSLQKINFIIPKGTTIALVGSSGAGKSSILDLLLRLYEPTMGKIEIDGINLTQFNIAAWRAKLGVVSQDTFIFNETFEENIRFGHSQVSLQEIMEVAKMCGIHELIMQLPLKYQTVLGEKGYRLSGGEKQKIALARALIRDPEILILDEASSSLDTHSERLIQNAIAPLQGKKTIIIVAHRLSTIMNANTIFVLEKGEIVETGSHDFLLDKNGRYAHFWNIQSKYSLEHV